MSINIYGKNVLIIIFGDELTGIHIKSGDVAKSFEEYFKLLWKQAKK